MATPDPPPLPPRPPLPAPSSRLEFLACITCAEPLRYLRLTTPDGIPDFVFRLSPTMWLGWSECEGQVELVAACNGHCLARYIDRRMKGFP
jgi:hypothetical protein